MITIIVAIASDGAIGKNGNLLWHLSGDLKRFKKLTSGHAVVMGRKTWESLPKRPLPGRLNVVVTSAGDYVAPGATLAGSLKEAIDLAYTHEGSDGNIFIIGGASIYRQALPLADAIDLTVVEAEYPDADAHFPIPSPTEWIAVEESEVFTDEKSGLRYRHLTLTRHADRDCQ